MDYGAILMDKLTWRKSQPLYKEDGLWINGCSVMPSWEESAMKEMAEKLSCSDNAVVEIGYGLGFSSSVLHAANPKRYTIIELNTCIANKARRKYASSPCVDVINKDWRDCGYLGEYDCIFFDPYNYGSSRSPYVLFLKKGFFIRPDSRVAIWLSNDHLNEEYASAFFEEVNVYKSLPSNNRSVHFAICSGYKNPLSENNKRICQIQQD